MAIEIKRNPLYLAPKLSWDSVPKVMTHFAAMLDGSKIETGFGEDNIDQRGASDYIFPTNDLQDLQNAIAKNRKAIGLFATVLLPVYFVMDVIKITADTVRKTVNTTILHSLTPISPIISGIANIAKRVKNKRIEGYEPLQFGQNNPPKYGSTEDIHTLITNPFRFTIRPFTHLIGVNQKGYKGSKLLTRTFQQRINDTSIMFDQFFLIPAGLARLPLGIADYSTPILNRISWALFPLRWAFTLVEIGLEAGGKLVSAGFKLVSLPIVGIVHGFSLIKYKKFKAAVRDLDIEIAQQNQDDPWAVQNAEDFQQRKVQDLVHEGGSYKMMLQNSTIENMHTEKNHGHTYLTGNIQLAQNEDEGEAPHTVRIEITDENRDTVLAALKRNAFGWAQSLRDNHQLEEANELCGGKGGPRPGGRDDDVIEL